MDEVAQLEIARAILESLPDELSDEDKRQIAAEIAVMVSEGPLGVEEDTDV